MKKLCILLLCFLTFSCSEKNEVDPDLTKEFIGLWKSEVQESDRDDIWTAYNIKRISNDFVKIDVKQYFDAHQGDYEDYVDEYLFDSVKVDGSKQLKIKESRMYGPNKISYEGSGVVTGTKLTLNLATQYDGQDFAMLNEIFCTRQK